MPQPTLNPKTSYSGSIAATAATVAWKTLTVFARDRQTVLSTLLQGVLFLLVFRFVFAGAIDAGSLSYVDYMVPGLVTTALLFGATQTAITVTNERSTGFTDRVLSLPVSRLGITLGRLAAHTVIVLAAAATTLAAAFATGFRLHTTAPKAAAACVVLVVFALAFTALFLALGSAASSVEAAQGLAFIAIPLTFISSAIVPTTSMPSWLGAIAEIQPLTPMINTIRGLTQANLMEYSALTTTIAVLWAIGIAAVSVAVSSRLLTRARS